MANQQLALLSLLLDWMWAHELKWKFVKKSNMLLFLFCMGRAAYLLRPKSYETVRDLFLQLVVLNLLSMDSLSVRNGPIHPEKLFLLCRVKLSWIHNGRCSASVVQLKMNQRTALFARTWVQRACVPPHNCWWWFSNQGEWEDVSFALLQGVRCADVHLVMLFVCVWTKLGDKSMTLPALR